MKKIERITKRIESDKSIMRKLWEIDMEPDHLAEHLQRYCKAVKQGRLFCIIHSVSSSGMNRNMSFHECAPYGYKLNNGQTHGFMNFWSMFKALGYTQARKRYESDSFTVGGCGMDMVFATNYNVIHECQSLGVITKTECAKLAQMTPCTY